MNRTSKALARLGTGAVVAATFLAMPFALGSASADPSIPTSGAHPGLVSTPYPPSVGAATNAEGPAYGTNADIEVPQGPDTEGQATFWVYTADHETLSLTLSSSTAYFPTQTASAGNYGSSGGQAATCATSPTGTGTQEACKVSVADTAPEKVEVGIGASPNGQSTQQEVDFNGLHFTCSSVGQPQGAPAGPNQCISQAQINTATPQVVTYTAGGAPGTTKNLTATLSGSAQFVTTSGVTVQNSPANNQATCSTGADGTCSFSVIDAHVEAVDLTVSISDASAFPYCGLVSPAAAHTATLSSGITCQAQDGADAAVESINFAGAAVAAAELDLNSTTLIAPTSQTAGNGMGTAEPGDVLQEDFTLRGAPIPAGQTGCTPATVAAQPQNVCPGQVLANTTATLKVSDGFFTPNCTFPASTSPSSLGLNNYAQCSFNSAAAAGGKVGDLKSLTDTLQVKTDNNGHVLVSIGIAKDAGFDDNGMVTASISDGTIVPVIPGDENAASSSTCASATGLAPNPGLGTTGFADSATTPGGCPVNLVWTTNEAPLNGATAKDVVVPAIRNPNNNFITTENNDNATDTGTNNVPDVDRVVFMVQLTDQYGNLTSNKGAPSASQVSITKTGAGNLVACSGFSAVDACTGFGTAIPGAVQPDGSIVQLAQPVLGSYTNLVAGLQNRFEADANTPTAGGTTTVVDCYPGTGCPGGGTSGNPGVNDGTQTDTTSWNPETTTFATGFITGSASSASFGNETLGAAATASTDTLTINFYNQLAQAVVTFSVKPGHKVPTSTAVTVASTVLDQFKNPIVNATLQVVRSGANEASCTPVQDSNSNQYIPTNQAGKAGYTFSCNQAGASTVNVVVTGPGGTQLAAGKEVIHFTGSSAHLTREKPKLSLHLKGHKLALKVKTHPAVHGKTVMFYRLKHGLPHLVGAAKTGKSGKATLHLKLKSGKKYHFEAKVAGLKATKFNSKFSKTKTIKV